MCITFDSLCWRPFSYLCTICDSHTPLSVCMQKPQLRRCQSHQPKDGCRMLPVKPHWAGTCRRFPRANVPSSTYRPHSVVISMNFAIILHGLLFAPLWYIFAQALHYIPLCMSWLCVVEHMCESLLHLHDLSATCWGDHRCIAVAGLVADRCPEAQAAYCLLPLLYMQPLPLDCPSSCLPSAPSAPLLEVLRSQPAPAPGPVHRPLLA